MRTGHRLRSLALVVAVAIGVVWLFGVASLYRLMANWRFEIPLEFEVNRWWADGIGHFSVKGFRIFESTSGEAFIEGNFSVTYNPWRVWFAERQDVTIRGTNISSKYLRELLKDVALEGDAVGKLIADLSIASDGSVVVKSANVHGSWGEGTAAGSIDKAGILDLASTWILNDKVSDNMAGVIKHLAPLSNESIVNRSDPTVIQCFLRGHIERPSVRLVSNLFQVELG